MASFACSTGSPSKGDRNRRRRENAAPALCLLAAEHGDADSDALSYTDALSYKMVEWEEHAGAALCRPRLQRRSTRAQSAVRL